MIFHLNLGTANELIIQWSEWSKTIYVYRLRARVFCIYRNVSLTDRTLADKMKVLPFEPRYVFSARRETKIDRKCLKRHFYALS